MNSPAAKSPYAGYRFPAEVISHAVWLYYRGRDTRCLVPPAQIRTCPIRASGSYLGCLAATRSLGQG
jgi:hypothetical protein